MKKYNKIVRDNIPEIIRERGGKCKFHLAREMDACVYLIDKIGDYILDNSRECGKINVCCDGFSTPQASFWMGGNYYSSLGVRS